MEDYMLVITVVALAMIVLLILYFVLYRKFLYISKRYHEFMLGGNGESLEGTLQSLFTELHKVSSDIDVNRERMQKIEEVLDSATRGVGVVRFNAFQDTGSDLSFAVALLDGTKNGVVISSIYGREETRTYAKPIKSGMSTYPLSLEEEEAIKQAVASLHPPLTAQSRKQ